MMICKADFEELFPEIFAPATKNQRADEAKLASNTGPARPASLTERQREIASRHKADADQA